MKKIQEKPRYYFWEHQEYGIKVVPVYFDDDPKDAGYVINSMYKSGWKPIDLPLLCWRWVACMEE